MQTIGARLASVLSRGGWMQLARGVVAVGFVVLCWMERKASLGTVMTLIGVYALLDGLLLVWGGVRGRGVGGRRVGAAPGHAGGDRRRGG